MSKLARIVAPVAMLAVMSLGGVAHAQESGTSTPQTGASTPSSTPAPKAIPVTLNSESGRPGQAVKVSANVRGCRQPGSVQGQFRDRSGAVRPLLNQLVTGGSRFTALFVVNPQDAEGWAKVRVACDLGLPSATQGYASFWVAPKPGPVVVKVTPTAGGPGTVVKVTAYVQGGCDPADTFFKDSKNSKLPGGLDKGPDILSFNEPRMIGRYTITDKDAVGPAKFVVSCDAGTDSHRIGSASFQVEASRSPIPVRVTPQAGGRGTTVQITAEVGRCQTVHVWFYDSKSDGLTEAGGAKGIVPLRVTDAGTVTAEYTLTRKNATGPARFRVVCNIDIDNARVGEASFRVLASNGGGSGNNSATANGNHNTQFPKRIDTGLGGTTDGDLRGGIDPIQLLPLAGLLLITAAVGIRVRQAIRRRR
jgi:hypothetical protein